MNHFLAVLCAVSALFMFSADAFAKEKKGDVYVEGDATNRGTRVKPRMRVSPNESRRDNRSTKVNMNQSPERWERRSRN
jgi:hypothetical protein